MFSLQLFADDNFGSVLDEPDSKTNSDVSDAVSDDIPDELKGIPEDTARQILNNSADNSDTVVSNTDSSNSDSSDTSVADSSDAVSYQKFKDVVDQKASLESQLAAYKNKFGDLNPNPPPQNPRFNSDVIKQIDDTILQRALEISGFSKDDIANLDYLDDNDPRISLWNHAKRLSESSVYNDIIANHIAQQQEIQRLQFLQNQTVNAYNDFIAQKQAASNFDAVKNFATNEFFNSQSPVDKEIIADSFARLSQNRVTPADMMILRDFYSRAESAFNSKQAPVAPPPKPPKQMPQFPRTNQLQGSAGGDSPVTEAQLKDMLLNKKWSEIPTRYQKLMLGL